MANMTCIQETTTRKISPNSRSVGQQILKKVARNVGNQANPIILLCVERKLIPRSIQFILSRYVHV